MINDKKNTKKRFLDTRELVLLSLFIALDVVLVFVRIEIAPTLWITFSYLPIAFVAMRYGFAKAATAAVIGDLLKYLIKPSGPFHIGFTVIAAIAALIYALFFYKEKITILRAVLARVCISVFVNIILNSLLLAQLYGKGFWVYALSTRVVKNLLLLPVEIALLYFFLREINKLLKRSRH